jgi:hypothetical protein
MPVSDKVLSYNPNILHRRQVVTVHTHTHPATHHTQFVKITHLHTKCDIYSCSCQIKHKEDCHITIALQFYIRENTINLSKLALLSHRVSGPYIRRS